MYVVLYKIRSGWRLFWAGESENIMKERHNEAAKVQKKVISGPITIMFDWNDT